MMVPLLLSMHDGSVPTQCTETRAPVENTIILHNYNNYTLQEQQTLQKVYF